MTSENTDYEAPEETPEVEEIPEAPTPEEPWPFEYPREVVQDDAGRLPGAPGYRKNDAVVRAKLLSTEFREKSNEALQAMNYIASLQYNQRPKETPAQIAHRSRLSQKAARTQKNRKDAAIREKIVALVDSELAKQD